jgi:gluconokinase
MTAGTGELPAALVVMGVSGSGKTTIAALLAKELGWAFEDADWFHPPANIEKMQSGIPLTDADRRPWLEAIARMIEHTSVSGGHCVVACSALKRDYRTILVGEHPEAVRLVYLKGDKEMIANRMAARHDHFMPTTLLDSQLATLEEPGPDENPITVSIDAHAREIVRQIIKGLGRPEQAGGARLLPGGLRS